MRYSECTIYAHFITAKGGRQNKISAKPLKTCPRVGDECRFNISGETKFFEVVKVVWCFDEDHDMQRVNLAVEEIKVQS